MKSRVLRYLPSAFRQRIVRNRMAIDDAAVSGLVVKVADAVPEIEQAARLLHDVYVDRDLIPPHPSRLRVTPHLVLPSTLTLVAKREHEVVGTLSVVLDSSLGLPMEKVFAKELRRFRNEERKLAEFGGLCIAREHRNSGLVVLLYRLAVQISTHVLEVDDFFFSIHPHAEDVYRSWFFAERVGPVRCYPGLNDSAIGVAMRVDAHRLESDMRSAFHRMPGGAGNPYDLFYAREYPQIRTTDDRELLEKIRIPRVQAAVKLLPQCPETVAELDARSFRALQAELPHVDLHALAERAAVSGTEWAAVGR